MFYFFRDMPFSLNLGTNGVAYSSVAQSLAIFLLTFGFSLLSVEMHFCDLFRIRRNEYSWLKKWSKQGFFSGLDSLIRNSAYIFVVLKAMNELNDQSLYWMANTFIWSWLLLPVLALSEMLKQDIATNHSKKETYKSIAPAYIFLSISILLTWIVTSPGWYTFISDVLNPKEDDPYGIAKLVYQLMPGYAFFIISSLNGSVFYAKGKVIKSL